MKVLIIGSGGREHAVALKLKESPKVTELFCAPGNGGIAQIANCVGIKATDISGIVNFSKENNIDMVVVAPDDPLMLGMVDTLENEGIRAFGPKQNAAIIEGSKVFSKDLMKKYNIPSAEYEVFDDMNKALEYIDKKSAPIVVKADGLALGKGVVVAQTVDEAKNAINKIMGKHIFGSAGDRVVIEEYLEGPEVSVLAFTDGKTIKSMVSAQDHKRIYDNDKGPNTGGMGTFSPSKIYTAEIAKQCEKDIFIPTINAMKSEGRIFKGVLYFGLMQTSKGMKVIEYNARFGDPETQVILPCLKTDLLDIFNAIIDEKLDEINIEWDEKTAVCVVMASGGYPLQYEIDKEISGLEELKDENDIIVYHAGTKIKDGKLLTSGGRVLGVTAIAGDIDTAREKAYKAVNKISFEGAYYRKDIGIKK